MNNILLKKHFDTLRRVKLFSGIEDGDFSAMLSCLNARLVRIKKDAYALSAGEEPTHIGIVLEGSLHVIREDSEGNRAVITALNKGEIFGEALCCAGIKESPVSVAANRDSAALIIEYGRILRICPNSCKFHARLVENMLFVLANKNIILQNRMELIGKKTLRRKIISYLKTLAPMPDGSVKTPFNREAMADFLCVDRSALSHELSRMSKEGILVYHKDSFKLLEGEEKRM